LQDVIRLGTGVKALYLHRSDLAGKTGTTNNQMDAWFCGYNSNLVSTVWMGYDQSRSLYEHAFTAAVPMWAAFMQKTLQTQPIAPVQQPSNIITARIDKNTGLLTTSKNNTLFEFFEHGTEPKRLVNNNSALLQPSINNNIYNTANSAGVSNSASPLDTAVTEAAEKQDQDEEVFQQPQPASVDALY